MLLETKKTETFIKIDHDDMFVNVSNLPLQHREQIPCQARNSTEIFLRLFKNKNHCNSKLFSLKYTRLLFNSPYSMSKQTSACFPNAINSFLSLTRVAYAKASSNLKLELITTSKVNYS